jgi:predicted metal-dependent phosphoesterase TrpH
MLHRFDLHVHSFFSADAASAPGTDRHGASTGLSGIAITDHDTCEAHEYLTQNGLDGR